MASIDCRAINPCVSIDRVVNGTGRVTGIDLEIPPETNNPADLEVRLPGHCLSDHRPYAGLVGYLLVEGHRLDRLKMRHNDPQRQDGSVHSASHPPHMKRMGGRARCRMRSGGWREEHPGLPRDTIRKMREVSRVEGAPRKMSLSHAGFGFHRTFRSPSRKGPFRSHVSVENGGRGKGRPSI